MPISNPKDYPINISIAGDGNCLFNAFALGLKDLILTGFEIDDLVKAQLLSVLNPRTVLNSERQVVDSYWNWEDFANFLLMENDQTIQNTLAPVLRNMACNELQITSANDNPTLQSNFSAGVYNAILDSVGLPRTEANSDDMFIEHDFFNQYVKTKIDELKTQYENELAQQYQGWFNGMLWGIRWYRENKINKEIQKDMLIIQSNSNDANTRQQSVAFQALENIKSNANDYWIRTAYQEFVLGMRTTRKWAGDLEASVLARKFKVNLTIFNITRAEGARSESAFAAVDDFDNAPTIHLQHQGNHWTYRISEGFQNALNKFKLTLKSLKFIPGFKENFEKAQTLSSEIDKIETKLKKYLNDESSSAKMEEKLELLQEKSIQLNELSAKNELSQRPYARNPSLFLSRQQSPSSKLPESDITEANKTQPSPGNGKKTS